MGTSTSHFQQTNGSLVINFADNIKTATATGYEYYSIGYIESATITFFFVQKGD